MRLLTLAITLLIGVSTYSADVNDKLIDTRTSTDYGSCSKRDCGYKGYGKSRRYRCDNKSGRKHRTVTIKTYQKFNSKETFEERSYGSWSSCR